MSCLNRVTENKEKTASENIGRKQDLNNINGIRFKFSAGRINTFKETIEINAALFNDNSDTVYFLTSTCEGEQFSLRFDTAEFTLTPLLNCNASYPMIEKIAPHGQYNFHAHFRCSSIETKIRLGFDFYQVNKTFKLSHKNPAYLNIFNRPVNEQKIIWADETEIK
jgi:hypothetical protein